MGGYKNNTYSVSCPDSLGMSWFIRGVNHPWLVADQVLRVRDLCNVVRKCLEQCYWGWWSPSHLEKMFIQLSVSDVSISWNCELVSVFSLRFPGTIQVCGPGKRNIKLTHCVALYPITKLLKYSRHKEKIVQSLKENLPAGSSRGIRQLCRTRCTMRDDSLSSIISRASR